MSHLILMNPAPASAADFAILRAAYVRKLGPDLDRQKEMMATPAYQRGEPEAVTARYRLQFKPALRRTGDYEKLMARMGAAFESQGAEGIGKARAVEDRLMAVTWASESYDLLPRPRELRVPTLIIYGDHHFRRTRAAQ